MSHARSWPAAALAAALALALVLLSPAVARADDRDDPPPATADPDLSLRWEGSSGGALTVPGALWGEVTVVPGDSDTRVITVRNDGPTDGTLTVSIVNATTSTRLDDPGWVDDAFYDDLTVGGVSASALAGTSTVVHEVPLARGETVQVPLSYAFDGWTGNRTGGGLEHPSGATVNPDGVGARSFTFDVQLRIEGDSTPVTDAAPGNLTQSGGRAVLAGPPWPLLAAAALVLVAAVTARAVRPRHAAQGEEPRR